MVRAMFKEFDCNADIDGISFNGDCIIDCKGSGIQVMLELKNLLIELFQHNPELVIYAMRLFKEEVSKK